MTRLISNGYATDVRMRNRRSMTLLLQPSQRKEGAAATANKAVTDVPASVKDSDAVTNARLRCKV